MQEFNLLPLCLAFTNQEEFFGAKRLMTHQVETKKSNCKLTTIYAPTASGKTLAFLARIVEANKNAIKDAMIVLPTNELLEDQAKSIEENLRQEGRSVTVNFEPDDQQFNLKNDGEKPVIFPTKQPEPDYAILVVSGDRLSKLANGSKGATLAKLLDVQARRVILITNPDTVHLIFRAKYYKSGAIFKKFLRFRILILDEFHLYHGTTLVNLIFLLWTLKEIYEQLIIATATPSEAISRIAEFVQPKQEISARESINGNGRTVRYPMYLQVFEHPNDNFFYDANYLDFVSKQVLRLYEKNKSSPSPIKTLVIVNSIAFCIDLVRRLKEEAGEEIVSEIHSLVPKDARRRSEITIGTSAIEVGIDFDAASILFEARDAPSFIQRVGRAARHRNADGIAIVPSETALYLKDNAPRELTYRDLRDIMYKAMVDPPTYHEFLSSQECAELYSGFLFGMAQLAQNEYPNRVSLVSYANDPSHQPTFLDVKHFKEYVSSFPRKKLMTISDAGLRGYLKSIPVYFNNYNRLTRVGFFEIPMLKIKDIIPADEFRQDRGKIDEHDRKVIIADDFASPPHTLKMTWSSSDFQDIEYISEDKARIECDSGWGGILFKLIEGLPAYATRNRPDWRFPAIRHSSKKEWLVIGLDAYLQAFLDHRVVI